MKTKSTVKERKEKYENIEILKEDVEMKVDVTLSMLLCETKRRGTLRFRIKGGDIYEITHSNPNYD